MTLASVYREMPPPAATVRHLLRSRQALAVRPATLRPVTFIAMKTDAATLKRVYAMSLAGVYPHYVAKAEKKGRTKAEVDEIIRWLTGYSQQGLEAQLENRTDCETFLAQAPHMNSLRTLIKGVVCGVRVEEVAEPTMRELRYLDKLIDELAKGKAMEKILRRPS